MSRGETIDHSASTCASTAATTGETRLRRWALLLSPAMVFVPVLWILSDGVGRSSGEPLPVLAAVPGFSLTSSEGRPVTSGDLRGLVWVADFIFTTCAGPCPELTRRMYDLQGTLEGRRQDVRLVSFTLNPEYDTPRVLKRYAERNGADPELWWFLTGDDERAVRRLVQEGFLQTVVPASADNPIIHSTYLVLVDRQGRIRGFYDGLDTASTSRVLQDVHRLLREPTG